MPGVYLVYACSEKVEKLVNITGKFGNQLLFGRINNTQENIARQLNFEKKILELNLSHIKIDWFVTFNDKVETCQDTLRDS